MRVVLNIIWLLFGGVALFFEYIIAGVIACIFIITIPAGVASFRIASYVLWPFGRQVVQQPGAGVGSALMNFVWFIVAGWWLALSHIATGILMAITIVGIPLAIGNFKMIPVTCFPFGKQIIDRQSADFPG